MQPAFLINLHIKDLELLKQIQLFFGVGTINIKKTKGSALFSIQSIKDLTDVIIPYFDKYPIITKKRADYLLFKKVVDLINKKEHLTQEGLNKIVSIRCSMNNGPTPSLIKDFPDIKPFERPIIDNQEIKDPHWLAGFVDGDGCFEVIIRESKTAKFGTQVILRFSISQHSRDAELIKSLVKYLACGVFYEKAYSVEFIVTKLSDILEKRIPFFEKYALQGDKRSNYADFYKVAMLMKDKAHLTPEGLALIKEIRSGMNTDRIYSKPVDEI